MHVYTTQPNSYGRAFAVVVVLPGGKYGRGDSLTHDGPLPLVEFYDTKYAGRDGFDPEGQFVARYDYEVLAGLDKFSRNSRPRAGLALMCSEKEWFIEADEMVSSLLAVVRALVESVAILSHIAEKRKGSKA